MAYTQRDLVWIKDAQMPDGKRLTHPFLILSCEAARQKEPGYYYGIMMTTSKHKDIFSMPVSSDMFESQLPKDSTHLRLYIISSFLEKDIDGLVSKMKKVDFKLMLDQLKKYILVCDS